ncbi:hypothetical protein BN873_410007 [Candidatus Competibacter denitrificans Run_A_D11]|uniref:Uncharacterized protein n=1 Tax=Candidatus Competibacter denitrificans Run_A_D11 TaxID=1400863 RepID=W6MAY0_9GAMM|nr:hypothetical protein BN873_410007 [Candidatus Competibacter denitrificans Run_A_D11]
MYCVYSRIDLHNVGYRLAFKLKNNKLIETLYTIDRRRIARPHNGKATKIFENFLIFYLIH